MSKYRVHELAKELDISSHDLIDMLQDLGIEAKSHMCSISEADALEILALQDDSDAKKTKAKKPVEVKKEEVVEKASEKAGKTDKKKKRTVEESAEKEGVEVVMPITVNGFGQLFNKSANEVIVKLMGLGVMANVNQELDEETVELLAEAFKVKMYISEEEEVHEEEDGIDNHEDKPEQQKSRPPVITVMGHVDHGKTSLLDSIRSSGVADTEAGGITQHIGASEVFVGQNKIVFLDTPGHEAFTSMRARGAQITDIAILVVAADDGVKPQTIEAINHAKSADVPIIVAVNKMDKPEANPTRVYQELSEHGILVEEWGGDTISAAVSAKTGDGIDNLLEMILLQAEVLELKANPSRFAKGTVVESKLDKAKGPVVTVIVQNGSMSVGDSIVVGATYGRVRAMTNSHGAHIKKAGPSTAVEILGLNSVPLAGDQVDKVKDDKTAKSISDKRSARIRHERMKSSKPISLDDVFNKMKEGQLKDLNIILKADVQGSVGAIEQSLAKISNEEVNVRVIHSGVGTITEADILLAQSANAIIIGFNVRPSTTITNSADEAKVDIRTYRIIYEAIDDIEHAMKGMLDPEFREVILGKVEIRETFKVPNIGTIGGAYVIEGKVTRNAEARLVRDGIVLFEGKISSLKRFKDDVKEVASGYECGIGLERYNDIKEGDIVEAYTMEEIPR